MKTINEILSEAYEDLKSTVKVAKLYDVYPEIVVRAIRDPNWKPGSLMERRILRCEIAHIQARKNGNKYNSAITNKDMYKGNRR